MMYKMYVDGIVWKMRFPCRFFLSDHTNMVLAPCHKGNQGKIGAKTVPRNHANKNMSCKNNDFALFSAIKSIEDTTKNAIQIP